MCNNRFAKNGGDSRNVQSPVGTIESLQRTGVPKNPKPLLVFDSRTTSCISPKQSGVDTRSNSTPSQLTK